jgi:hypothetical protein
MQRVHVHHVVVLERKRRVGVEDFVELLHRDWEMLWRVVRDMRGYCCLTIKKS